MSEPPPYDPADENEQQAARLRREADRIREGRAATIEQAAREALEAVAAGKILEAAEALLWASQALRHSIRAPGWIEESAAGLEGLARRQREARLTSKHESNTFEPMNAIPTEALQSQSAYSEYALGHRFVQAMIARNLTVPDVCQYLEDKLRPKLFPRSTVQSWYKDPEEDSYRAIPEEAEREIRAWLKVPRSAWHRIKPAKKSE